MNSSARGTRINAIKGIPGPVGEVNGSVWPSQGAGWPGKSRKVKFRLGTGPAICRFRLLEKIALYSRATLLEQPKKVESSFMQQRMPLAVLHYHVIFDTEDIGKDIYTDRHPLHNGKCKHLQRHTRERKEKHNVDKCEYVTSSLTHTFLVYA